MKTIAIYALLAAIAVVVSSCRVNSTTTQNYVTLGTVQGNVDQKGFRFGEGSNEATQAADKKVGDIAPKANVAAGPLSKATEAGNNADAGSTGPAVPAVPTIPTVPTIE
jgi:hypothetical protein